MMECQLSRFEPLYSRFLIVLFLLNVSIHLYGGLSRFPSYILCLLQAEEPGWIGTAWNQRRPRFPQLATRKHHRLSTQWGWKYALAVFDLCMHHRCNA